MSAGTTTPSFCWTDITRCTSATPACSTTTARTDRVPEYLVPKSPKGQVKGILILKAAGFEAQPERIGVWRRTHKWMGHSVRQYRRTLSVEGLAIEMIVLVARE